VSRDAPDELLPDTRGPAVDQAGGRGGQHWRKGVGRALRACDVGMTLSDFLAPRYTMDETAGPRYAPGNTSFPPCGCSRRALSMLS